MSIEYFQKIADLLLKGVGATAIAAGGLYVSLNKNRLDQSSACIGMSEKLYMPVEASLSLEQKQRRMSLLIDRYNDACTTLSDNETDFLMNSLQPVKDATSGNGSPPITGTGTSVPQAIILPTDEEPLALSPPVAGGWVVVGRVGGSYGQINFDGADKLLTRPLSGAEAQVLKARWPVNLRANTSNTKLGENKVLAVVEAGECVSSGPLVETRGQVWTRGKLVDC